MSNLEFLDFHGSNGAEAEDFIRAVNRAAWTAGQYQDSVWKAEFASTAFSGKALRWYQHLKPETKKDWAALQAAVLDYFQEEPLATPSETSVIMPTPPAAVPHPTLPSRMQVHEAMTILSQATITARIKVVGSSKQSYLSRQLNSSGIIQTTEDLADSLLVQVSVQSRPCDIKLMNASFEYPLLGGAHFSTDEKYMKFGPGCSGYMALVGCTRSSTHTATCSWNTNVTGPIESSIWTILSDGTISPRVKQDGTWYCLISFLSPTGGLVLTSHLDGVKNSFPRIRDRPVVELKLAIEEEAN